MRGRPQTLHGGRAGEPRPARYGPHVGCPVHEGFDPLSEAFLADPYAAMPDEPVFYAPSLDYHVVTRYADVEQVFLDPATYSAATAQLPLIQLEPEALKILAEGGHRPQPSMVSLDAVDVSAPFDLVSALTFPLPASIVFSFMGVPPEDWAQLKRWCGSRATLAWGRPAPEEQVEHARNMAAYRGYLRALVQSKVDDRADDYASALLAIHDEDPEALSHEEIASILFSLSFAGHETTNYLIGNLIRRLLERRERWEAVVADRGLIPGAVDETLRYDTSVPVWRRVTTRPVTLGGVDLPEGAKLFLWLASTGRDAATFPDPDVFDMTRANAHHNLAFGKGIHYCVGMNLGKLEARLALAGLIERWPDLRLVEDQQIPFHPNISFRGPMELWATGGDLR